MPFGGRSIASSKRSLHQYGDRSRLKCLSAGGLLPPEAETKCPSDTQMSQMPFGGRSIASGPRGLISTSPSMSQMPFGGRSIASPVKFTDRIVIVGVSNAFRREVYCLKESGYIPRCFVPVSNAFRREVYCLARRSTPRQQMRHVSNAFRREVYCLSNQQKEIKMKKLSLKCLSAGGLLPQRLL